MGITSWQIGIATLAILNGVFGGRGFVLEDLRLVGWGKRFFFGELGKPGRIRWRLLDFRWFDFVKALGRVDGLAVGGKDRPRHGYARTGDELYLDPALVAPNPCPFVALPVKNSRSDGNKNKRCVQANRIPEELLDFEIVRVGEGSSHLALA